MGQTMLDLSIVIVNWNTRDLADQAIASLYRHEDPSRFEIILVDNASTDGSAAHLISKYPQVRVIANDRNVGFAKANNQGAAMARGKHLLLFNSDAYLDAAVLDRCMKIAKAAGPCLLGCRLLNRDGSVQLSADRFPSVGKYLLEVFSSTEREARRSLKRQAGWNQESNRVDWLTGAFLLLDLDLYLSLGGLEESIFMYGEDVELCHRAGKSGIPCIYAPGPAVVHLGGGSVDYQSLRSLMHTDTGRIRTFRVMKGPFQASLLRAVFILRSAIRVAVNALAVLVGRNASARMRLEIHFKEILNLSGLADERIIR